MTTAAHLRGVEAAASLAAATRAAFENEIKAARKAGAPLREIAKAAGLSYEGVRRITMKESV